MELRQITETIKYNKDKDKIIFVIGHEDEVPPRDVFEEIAKMLGDFDKNQLYIVPDIIKKIVVIRDDEEKIQRTRYSVSRSENQESK